MVRSFRSKPIGWRNDNYRHYLAAKGVSTRMNFYAVKDYLKGNRESGGIKSAAAKGWSKDALLANPVVAAKFGVDVRSLEEEKSAKGSALPEFSESVVRRDVRVKEPQVREEVELPSRIEVSPLTEEPTVEEDRSAQGVMTPGISYFGGVDFERGPQ
jgi:hypothetical protein